MHKQKRIVIICIMIFVVSMSGGCAKKAQVKHSGFLDDYSDLKPGPEGGIEKVYFKEGVDFGSYNRVMMDHVVFYFKEDSEYKGIHPDVLKELADAFHSAAAEALADAYPLVDEPGPDVMRIRAAITELVPGKPGLTFATVVAPGGFAVKAVKKAATGSHGFTGKTSMEAEILDSMSGERIAAVVDDGEGDEKMKLQLSELTEGMSKWGDVKGTFAFWAQRLRKWLDKTHGIEIEE